MRALNRWNGVVALAAVLYGIGAVAVDFKRLDGVHRLEKKAQITAPAKLQLRDGDQAPASCAASLTLCPSEMDGGCCPDGYECAKESCYATTKGPSTCGSKVGWHACEAVYGGGCCPDGLRCNRGNACLPPPGSSYTYGCPASHYLCPSSMNYGCCPNGMGCAVNQCYSTKPETITTKMVITTTRSGDEITFTTTSTSTRTPRVPTALPTVDSGEDDGQIVLKYFPSSVAKVSAEAAPEEKDKDGGLSKGALGGIVAGAIILLIIVLIAAWLVLRRLNKVAAAVKASKPPSAAKSGPQMRQGTYQPTESEMDGVGITPSQVSPPASVSTTRRFRLGQRSPDHSVHSQAASSFAGGYQVVSPGEDAQPTFDMSGNIIGYFDHAPMKPRRAPSTTAASLPRVSEDSQAPYTHGRQWSNASETSDQGAAMNSKGRSTVELEGDPYVPELVGSPITQIVSPLEETGTNFSNFSGFSVMQPMAARKKGNSPGGSRSETAVGPLNQLDVVDEETNSFQGMSYHIMGQPAYQPVKQNTDEHDEYGGNAPYSRR